jgi:hypothetical protein
VTLRRVSFHALACYFLAFRLFALRVAAARFAPRRRAGVEPVPVLRFSRVATAFLAA